MFDKPGDVFDAKSKSLLSELKFKSRSKFRSKLKLGVLANGDARMDGDFPDNDDEDTDRERAKTLVDELGICSFSLVSAGADRCGGAYTHLSMLNAHRRHVGFVSSHCTLSLAAA